MSKNYEVRLESEEYGYETFTYDTKKDAEAGYKRLVKSCIAHSADDRIFRTLELVEVLKSEEILTGEE